MKRRSHSKQWRGKGMALIFALLALVALTLGAVALIRSVDAGVLALGNMSFKQSGVSSSSRAVETAITWLQGNLGGAALDADIVNQGYYASSMDGLDATGRTIGTATQMAQVDWDNDNCKGLGSAALACIQPSPAVVLGDETIRYVITRLCANAGSSASGNSCAVPVVGATVLASGRGDPSYNRYLRAGGATYSAYYRIIARTAGPRGTLSFTETMVHF